jgi:hypothetical protein
LPQFQTKDSGREEFKLPTSPLQARSAGRGSTPIASTEGPLTTPTRPWASQRIEARDSNPTGDFGSAPTSITLRREPMAFFSCFLFALLNDELNDASAMLFDV